MRKGLAKPKVAQPVCRKGFALIEMIGVLVVLSILALALAPVFLKRVDIAAVNAETATLNSINNALVLQILRSNSIPSEADWADAVGNWLALSPANITTNSRNHSRAYLVDAGGWLGTNLPTTGYYSQSATGTTLPNSARIMIVSSMTADLLVANGRPSTAIFNDLWNTPAGTIPANAIWSGWGGRGDDLLIQRINLQPLFSQLILVNRDTNNAAAFSIAGQTNLVMSRAVSNAYYFTGSVVGLGSTNSGGTNLQTIYVLNRSASFVFDSGMWGGQAGNALNLLKPASSSSEAFSTLAQAFLAVDNSPNNAGPNGAAGDQQQVLAAMHYFMNIYTLWANYPNDSFTLHGVSPGQAKSHLGNVYLIQDAQQWLTWTAGTNRNNSVTFNGTTISYSGLLY